MTLFVVPLLFVAGYWFVVLCIVDCGCGLGGLGFVDALWAIWFKFTMLCSFLVGAYYLVLGCLWLLTGVLLVLWIVLCGLWLRGFWMFCVGVILQWFCWLGSGDWLVGFRICG